jgi:hypothetical protein
MMFRGAKPSGGGKAVHPANFRAALAQMMIIQYKTSGWQHGVVARSVSESSSRAGCAASPQHTGQSPVDMKIARIIKRIIFPEFRCAWFKE